MFEFYTYVNTHMHDAGNGRSRKKKKSDNKGMWREHDLSLIYSLHNTDQIMLSQKSMDSLQ